MEDKATTTIEEAAQYIASHIAERLRAGKRVVWFLSGGSAIKVAVAAAAVLREQGELPLGKLAVTLGDERYGDAGHPDSNWTQLLQAGFDMPRAMLLPVLYGAGLEETAERFNGLLDKLLSNASYKIGLFGIGPDGHTAGMLPNTDSVEQTALAYSYDGGRYQRVTMTVPAIAKLDEAVVYALGEDKWPVIEKLSTDIPLREQPAQALKQARTLTIFTDYKGSTT
jgi:6-phosphogluconolactonase/glucosamine-6-phosphate isomerase/deaminase